MAKDALFVGSKALGLRALEVLQRAIPGQVSGVVTVDDSSDKRSVLGDFRRYSEQKGLPLTVLTRPSALKEVVLASEPQYVLVVGWYWILPPSLLEIVPGGFWGIHASLLPKYRGNAPLVWAIIRGETQTGVTLFRFDERMDTGEIAGQEVIEIVQTDTIAEVLDKAETAMVNLVSQNAKCLLAGKAQCRPQDHELAIYVSLRRPEDGKINWQQSAIDIYNFIRAQTRPYPGAFTYLPDGKKLTIWRAELFPFPYYGVPGLVAQRYGAGTVVVCGDGAIVVNECELEGLGQSQALKWGWRLG